MDRILIRGARQHNLRNVDLDLPRDRLVVITGVSGSGKTSLAFDTLFAESQRRYVEALSPYVRQTLGRLPAPDVDEIEGLSPAIALEQKGLSGNPRSTVGTLTEIHDYLRLLFSRLGTLHCPRCGIPVKAWTIPAMAGEIGAHFPEGSRLLVLAPLGEVKERDLGTILRKLGRDGFARVRVDGRVLELDPPPALPRRPAHRLEVVVDRVVLAKEKAARLLDSLETAAKVGHGVAGVAPPEGEPVYFSEDHRCLSCGESYPEPSPSLFSFHHPAGACPVCKGLGRQLTGDRRVDLRLLSSGGEEGENEAEGSGGAEAPDLETLPGCPACSGTRLNDVARSVLVRGSGIHQVLALPVTGLREWLESFDLPPTEARIAERPVREMLERLESMRDLGLEYLTMERSASTLSGGEAQRIRLTQQVGSRLSGVLYVLDEPSIGLHPADHERLLGVLDRLRADGNSLIVVEHDRETILRADHVVDMGPGAGEEGGKVLYAGPPGGLADAPGSVTGAYLSGRRRISNPARVEPFSKGALTVRGASGHNLRGVTVEFPLGCLVCVTGVSGSGKSTLVLDTLHRALAGRLHGLKAPPAPFESIEGAEGIRKVVLVDQYSMGRTPRSSPATATGIFDLIRKLYAQLPESRARGYTANRFSYNAKGGRCESCKGEGLQRVPMFFLPDLFLTCPVCEGSRYRRETLDVTFKGRSIASVLEMSLKDALGFFENLPSIRRKIETLVEVGLGYLKLGQSATTLSGGEAQRVKLATELSRKAAGDGLYILDEPTTGLHFRDIERLLHILRRLVALGHTVIVIEHHTELIACADWIVDLGPGGGGDGGRVVFAGTPDEVARADGSLTGRYLARALDRASGLP